MSKQSKLSSDGSERVHVNVTMLPCQEYRDQKRAPWLPHEIKSRSDLFRDVHEIRGSRGGIVETSDAPPVDRLFNLPYAFDLSTRRFNVASGISFRPKNIKWERQSAGRVELR